MKVHWQCAFCGGYFSKLGNLTLPLDQVYKTDICCNHCYETKVIPERLRRRKQAMNI